MIYTSKNVTVPCRVYDVDTVQEIRRVAEVNAKAGWIKVSKLPLRVNAHGQIESERIRFGSIHPIFGGAHSPVMFHCYGRLNASAT